MHSSAKTFLTALIAVAGAATMALVLAEQSAPQNLHTVAQPAAPQAAASAVRLSQLDCTGLPSC